MLSEVDSHVLPACLNSHAKAVACIAKGLGVAVKEAFQKLCLPPTPGNCSHWGMCSMHSASMAARYSLLPRLAILGRLRRPAGE